VSEARAEAIAATPAAAAPELSTGAGLAYASGTLGMSLFPSFLASWQIYYFAPPADSGRVVHASAITIGIVNLIGQIVHSLADGLIGHASDRTRTRWGRRIPWILVSSPICAAAFIGIWWPPGSTASWINVAWLVALRAVMWIAYTGAFGPYCALLPEISQGARRIRISVFMALFEVLGTILATAVAGAIIEGARDGATLGPLHVSDGFKLAAIVTGSIALVAMLASIAAVRETAHDASKDVKYSLWRAIVRTFENPAFRPYAASFVAFRMSLLAVLTLLPYQVNVVLGLDDAEAAAGTLQMVIVLGAVLLFPLVDRLARSRGKWRVMRWGFLGFAVVMSAGALVGRLPFGSPLAQAYAIYGLSTFPVATLLVLSRPILADVIDHDAALTGYRREGMYNGVEGLVTKLAEGVGPLVATALFALFGATRDQPLGVVLVGPVAAVFCLAGWWLFRGYPLRDV
jgi:GPH family glycoside/pentoside/hexuronide:cation symporter